MTNMKQTKRALLSSILALVLCFTMLLGTTYAWFTDSVTSTGNVIQTGKLKIGFLWADGTTDPANTTWTDATEGPIFDYANWEPGYSVARHLKVSNEGTLGLRYQMRIVANGVVTDLADAIDVYYIEDDKAIARDDLANAVLLGSLTQVLGTTYNLSNTINGELEAGADAHIHSIVLKMRESAGNEYQNMDLGCTFTVELIATQLAAEEDSFDNQYDNETLVPDPTVPAALVRPWDEHNITYTLGIGGEEFNATLDTAYQFEPTDDGVEMSEYRYWHADFVVSADQDVPANSMMLAGYYDAWCQYNQDRWVGLTADVDIPANTEVRLVENIGSFVNWEEICNFGNDGIGFVCGALDMTGVNAGTTITVELRIYETTRAWNETSGTANEETGKYITVGKYTYTFGINTPEKLAYALENGGEYVLTSDIELDDNTKLTVANGVDVTLDLNGHTISSAANNTGNQELFLVKGDLTVKNGSINYVAENNQGWNAMATIFDVTAGGNLVLDGVKASVGGTDMNFIVHLNNWGTASAEITNCDFDVTYVAVRAFNSGNDMNTVTIKETNVDGGRLFWVHNYTAEGKDDSTLTLDIYGNGNTCDSAYPVRFGFSGSVYYDLDGNVIQ